VQAEGTHPGEQNVCTSVHDHDIQPKEQQDIHLEQQCGLMMLFAVRADKGALNSVQLQCAPIAMQFKPNARLFKAMQWLLLKQQSLCSSHVAVWLA
jgi:hypothetical protein